MYGTLERLPLPAPIRARGNLLFPGHLYIAMTPALPTNQQCPSEATHQVCRPMASIQDECSPRLATPDRAGKHESKLESLSAWMYGPCSSLSTYTSWNVLSILTSEGNFIAKTTTRFFSPSFLHPLSLLPLIPSLSLSSPPFFFFISYFFIYYYY